MDTHERNADARGRCAFGASAGKQWLIGNSQRFDSECSASPFDRAFHELTGDRRQLGSAKLFFSQLFDHHYDRAYEFEHEHLAYYRHRSDRVLNSNPDYSAIRLIPSIGE